MRYQLDARMERNRDAMIQMIAEHELEIVEGDPETDLVVEVEGPVGLRHRRGVLALPVEGV